MTLSIVIGGNTYAWTVSISASADGKTMIFTASSAVITDSKGADVVNSGGMPVVP
jgi:hypothetical protein